MSDESRLFRCTVASEGFAGDLRGNVLVLFDLAAYALSVAGHERTIQALSAGLSKGGTRITLRFARDEWAKVVASRNHQQEFCCWPASGGFTTYKQHLGYDTWHLLAISKEPKFLLDISDEALWRVLRSDRFSTPLLRSWMPELRKSLIDTGLLKRCYGLGAESYMLLATPETLDRTVSAGLKAGALTIPAGAAATPVAIPA